MKRLSFFLCTTLMFFFCVPAIGQVIKKKVVVTIFEAKDYLVFDNPDNTSITEEDLREGFSLEERMPDRDSVSYTLVLKGANGRFEDKPKAVNPAPVGGVAYNIRKASKTDGFVLVQIARATRTSKDTVVIRIKITEGKPEPPNPVAGTLPCDTAAYRKLFAAKSSCVPSNLKNKYGENIDNYDKHTVVYVYDFSEDASNRRIRKVVKSGDTLLYKVVNFSTEKLDAKSDAYLKVVNVNRFLYDIIVYDSAVYLESEPNALFSRLFIGDSALQGSLLNVVTKDITGSQGKDSNAVTSNFYALVANIQCYLMNYNALQTKIVDAYNPCTSFPCCEKDFIPIFYDLSNRLLIIHGQAAVMQNMINDLKDKIKKGNEFVTNCATATKDRETLDKELKDLTARKTPTEDEKKRMEKLPGLIEEAKKKECSPTEVTQKKSEVAETTEEMKKYSSIDNLLAKLPTESDLRKVIVLIGHMNAKNSEELYPLSTSGNFIDLSMQIRSKDSIFKYFSLQPYIGPVTRRMIPVLRKNFISFSSGIFFGHPDYLKNKTYSWLRKPDANNTISDTSKQVLAESGYTSPAMGFVALGSIAWRVEKNLGVGVSLGPGITIEKKPRIVYFLGASAFFGDLRQFCITGGVAIMQLDKLDNQFEQFAARQTLFSNPPAITYHKEFRTGAFIALTYTPFKTRSKK